MVPPFKTFKALVSTNLTPGRPALYIEAQK